MSLRAEAGTPVMSRGYWHCPPGHRKGERPWCRNIPCQGHRVTSIQHTVARVLWVQVQAIDPDQSWWGLTVTEREQYYRDAAWLLQQARTIT